MNKNLSDSFSLLKDVLPRGYQGKIAGRLIGIDVADVKKAFNGQLKDRDRLLKILSAAQALAKEILEEDKRALEATEQLVNKVKEAV